MNKIRKPYLFYQRLCSECGVHPRANFVTYNYPLLQTELRLAALHLAAHLSAIPENPIQNFQQKIWKDGFNSVSLRQLDNIIIGIQNGHIQSNFGILDRYGRPCNQKIAVRAAIITRGEDGSGKAQSANQQYAQTRHSRQSRIRRQTELLTEFAILSGCWLNKDFEEQPEIAVSLNGKKYKFLAKGAENRVYDSGEKDEQRKVIKIIDIPEDWEHIFYDDVAEIFERILIHNCLFPNSILNIVGFADDGVFKVVLEQFYFKGTPPTDSEIDKYIRGKVGTLKPVMDFYLADGIYLGDFHDKNVIKDDDGNIIVIDDMLAFDDNALQGFMLSDTYYIDEKELSKVNVSLAGATNLEMQSAELDIVLQARAIAQNGESLRQRFDRLVELYDNQRTIRPTDTKSKLLQQYSTPCPLAFLASEYVKQYGKDCQYFEPSAGNGMLTISLPQNAVWVNELDEVRFENLKKQGYLVCSNQDATKKILPEYFPADGIITNPPFASLPKDEQITVNGFTLATLDYKMAYIALEQMKDHGRAAVIVGGKMFDNYWKPLKDTDKKVLFGQWKVFLGWLYAAYNVEDLIYIGGDYIYRKQGTTYPVVLILINGRRVPFSTEHKPDYIYDPLKNEIVTTYDQLFTRVAPTIQHHTPDAPVPSITPSFNDGNPTPDTAPSPLLTSELELAKVFFKQKDNFLFFGHNDKIFIQPTKNPKGAKSGFWLPFAKYDGDDQALSQTEILKKGVGFFNRCYPNGVVDVFLLSFNEGIGASKLYKKSYRDYEYVLLDDTRKPWDIAINNPDEYISLVQKGREMLYGGTFTGKKSTHRTGKAHLDGKDATEKMLQEQFGFKSVVHQVKITQKDYQALMNNTYNAFMDLAEICGIKNPKVLAHKSTLSLNLAAKASGDAYAYYSPKYLSLNLTRKEGSGTLAHEWFHSLDHWLGTMYGYRTNEYGYKYLTNDSFSQQYPNKALYEAVRHWVLVMEGQLSMYEKSKAADKRKKRKYWSKPLEMSARCFECYCLKKLAEKGLKNDFLVEDRLDESVYPSPEDEAKVIKCFDDLFAALNEYSQDGENFLYGSSPEIPEIENTVSADLIAQIPATEDDRRKFLTSELQRFEGTEIYSKYFNQNVIVLKKSLSEITKWAAKSKESIIAALNIDGVVANATKVNEDNPKPNKQTKEFYFNKMYEMHCDIKGVGTAKLMVGERKNGKKITYCITALRI